MKFLIFKIKLRKKNVKTSTKQTQRAKSHPESVKLTYDRIACHVQQALRNTRHVFVR